MISLDKDLQRPKNRFNDFYDITIRILNYLPNVISDSNVKNDYVIFSSELAGTKKFIRPINNSLFIMSGSDFSDAFTRLIHIFQRISTGETIFSEDDKNTIDSTLYTVQQSIGAGLDLMVNPNSARKHAGNRFEELIKSVFTELGVANKKVVLQIPYETDEGEKVYKCENDLILSPYPKVKSSATTLDENEVVVSAKTTSKDRMGKMFIDKILLERFVNHPQKVIGIFLNDVQRKEDNNISFTLVSGLFMVYSRFLTEIEGIYYLDPPPSAKSTPFSKYMHPLSELITNDLKRLLSS